GAMPQPIATSIAVPNANSSAPRSAATSRSRPVRRPPSVLRATRSRSPFRSNVWWTSARHSSHGAPTCLIELSGDAPVPPAWPERWTYVAPAFATPAAIVPTPRLAHILRPLPRGEVVARRYQLHPDPGGRVDRAEIGNQLGEILDRVDVVVRRRADVAHPGLAATKRRDPGRRLPRGELAAFAGLAALGDLDLQLLAAGQVRGGDPEPGGRDLLDSGVVTLAVGTRDVPAGVLAALPRVRRAAGPLDADGQRLVRLRRERPDRHRADDEAAGDRAGGLDVAQRDRAGAARPTDAEEVADHGGGGLGRRPGVSGGGRRRAPRRP